ncbi:MAG: porin [Rikenellaceae bacterium]|nr:porin [Rikenellaceae bacterium]
MKHLCTIILLLFATAASAQEELLKLGLEARVDYTRQSIDGDEIHDASGFKGRFINLVVNGNLGHGFRYAYRQQLNKANKDQSFFDATDHLYLSYTTPDNRWALTVGKQVVAVGGFEYDSTPIDAYFYSEYCSNIGCYQLGVSAMHTLKSGHDSFLAQVTESPFRTDEELFAYNLMWIGNHGGFHTLYSLNAMEHLPGEFIYYITLGHRLRLGHVTLDLDFMNRATDQQTFFFRNCSVMGQVKVDVGSYVQLQAKATYDVNRTTRMGDHCVAPGTELTRLGAVVEVYPIKGKRNVRLHAAYCYTLGSGSELNTLQDKQSIVDFGLTWRMNLLSFTPNKRK